MESSAYVQHLRTHLPSGGYGVHGGRTLSGTTATIGFERDVSRRHEDGKAPARRVSNLEIMHGLPAGDYLPYTLKLSSSLTDLRI